MSSYNNYSNFPYGMPYYNPYVNQPNYNNMNNQMHQQQPQMNQFAFVNGVEGAKSYQMMPNQTVMLMDSESPVVFMKQSNSMGQCSLKYYKLTEVSEQDLRMPTQEQKPSVEYALKTDLEALNKKLDELSTRFQNPLKEAKVNE